MLPRSWSIAPAAAMLCALLLLAGCGKSTAPGPAAPAATEATETLPAGAFGLARMEVESYEGRPAALLTFSRPLAGAQKFDELLAIGGSDGATVSGSWMLDEDNTRLRFPYLEANKSFKLTLKPALAAADGATLGKAVTRELYTGPLEPLSGFASQGSVLPAHDTRGLPVVSVNVPEIDVEFLRVRDADLGKFLRDYSKNGRRSYWSLDDLSKYALPVYANRFALSGESNERTLSFIPVRDIAELKAPGLYFAVMKRPGSFTSEFDTAMFFVSDIGVHVRTYPTGTVVHAASLKSGEPRAGVAVSVRDQEGKVLLTAETDGSGLATLRDYQVKPEHVLVAERAGDVSVIAFNQPALDLSEFEVAGRPQRAAEIFPWSGRDLYRPGETLRVAALLRDFDGKPLPAPQPLYATLKQPDGRALTTQRLEPGELGYYQFERRIAEDAATGRWSLEFSTDPTPSAQGGAFSFRVEEFLPERLKLELTSTVERLRPADKLPLAVEADYLYGAPAAGNRFTAKIIVANDDHPVAALRDFWFGDRLAELPKDAREVVDEALDAEGKLARELVALENATVSGPVKVIVSGSVYETGGRAVTRTLERTIWPAEQLVGARPLFDMADGANPWGDAGFELVRTNAEGELLAAKGLKVKVIREIRDTHWVHDPSTGWRADYTRRFETVDERTLDIPAGQRGKLAVPVEWGGYRLEVEDPETGLTLRLPFESGWGWDDDNRGDDARPDKVKLALDKTHYRGGETLRVTLTPPHAGPALLLLETDRLLWHRTLAVKGGTVVEIPLDPAWERHDLYLTAIVFRPGSVPDKVTPNRAVGVVHVPIARAERTVTVALDAPETMRPQQALPVKVAAPALAGQTAYVRLTAVDLGVLNITRFPLPDAAAWFFAQRRLGVDAYDVYARVIEAFEGEKARLRYGGDMALAAMPSARRPNADIQTVDLFHEPVALDAKGNATVEVQVPDFNGTLRVRALVYAADRYGAAETDTIVRAPLVVEASTPRVLAPGDSSLVTLDLQNMSGAAGDFQLQLDATGPVALERGSERVTLADQEKRTVRVGLTARDAFGVGEIRARVTGKEVNIDRRFRFVVRPAWPAVTRASATVLAQAAPVTPDAALLAGLIPASTVARISVGTLPPLPFGTAVKGLIGYPYGCIEQTTSRAYPLVWLDDATADRFGLEPVPQDKRAAMLADAFARLSAMQTDTGHFSMWPGEDYSNTQMTPYVSELLLNARDAGFAIPEPVLTKALDRINEDLLSGGNGHYDYENSEHLRLAEMSYGGYALARIAKAPVGTLRALYDNERASFVAPLPLVHLGVAFKLMGDLPRAEAAIEEAFTREFDRPGYLGDYGTELRDLALMVALTHEHGLAKPAYDARVFDLARELLSRQGDEAKPQLYLSTQEQVAIFRLGRALLGEKGRTFAATVSVAGAREELTGRSLVSRTLTPEQLAGGVSIVPAGAGPFYVSQDVAGVPRTAPEPVKDAELRIRRSWHLPDGKPFEGDSIAEGDVLVAHLLVESGETMNDALVVDLLPGGLEIENLNLVDASQWQNVVIDGVNLSERENSAQIRHEEYRDDRYVAAIKLWGGSSAHLFYLVRAVSPGEFVMPPPGVEDMYRPELRAAGAALPARIKVTPP